MFYVCLKPCCSVFLPGPHCSVRIVLYCRPTCPWSRSILAASSASCEEDEEQNEGVHVIVGLFFFFLIHLQILLHSTRKGERRQVEQQVTVRSIKHQKTCSNSDYLPPNSPPVHRALFLCAKCFWLSCLHQGGARGCSQFSGPSDQKSKPQS